MHGEPVRRAECAVHVEQARRQRDGLLLREQGVALAVDLVRMRHGVLAEFVRALEDQPMPERHLVGARLLFVGGEPEGVERPAALRRRSVGPVGASRR